MQKVLTYVDARDDPTFKAEMARVIESLLKAGCRRVMQHQLETGFGREARSLKRNGAC